MFSESTIDYAHSRYLIASLNSFSGFGGAGLTGLDRVCVLHLYRRTVSSCLRGINCSVLLFCACMTASVFIE